MAAQLLGTGGIAVLLLLAQAVAMPGVVDVALVLAVAGGVYLGRLCQSRRASGRGRSRAGGQGMRLVLDALTIAAVSAGAFFFLAGTVGLLRFPDALSRLHALTKADNLGLGLIVFGLMFQAAGSLAALKLIGVWLLALLAGAVVTQLIALAARRERAAGVSLAFASTPSSASRSSPLPSGRSWRATLLPRLSGLSLSGCCWRSVWVRLAAPDVALTEAAIGSGVTGGLLSLLPPPTQPTPPSARVEPPLRSFGLSPLSPASLVDGGARRDCVCCCPTPRRRWRRRRPRISR